MTVKDLPPEYCIDGELHGRPWKVNIHVIVRILERCYNGETTYGEEFY